LNGRAGLQTASLSISSIFRQADLGNFIHGFLPFYENQCLFHYDKSNKGAGLWEMRFLPDCHGELDAL